MSKRCDEAIADLIHKVDLTWTTYERLVQAEEDYWDGIPEDELAAEDELDACWNELEGHYLSLRARAEKAWQDSGRQLATEDELDACWKRLEGIYNLLSPLISHLAYERLVQADIDATLGDDPAAEASIDACRERRDRLYWRTKGKLERDLTACYKELRGFRLKRP